MITNRNNKLIGREGAALPVTAAIYDRMMFNGNGMMMGGTMGVGTGVVSQMWPSTHLGQK